MFTLGCGAVLTGESGTITSPRYPNSYPSNVDCTWDINAHPSRMILIEFEDIEIEDDSKCGYDKLLIQEKYGVSINSIQFNSILYNNIATLYRSVVILT